MKIYTRTGDEGMSSLCDGTRVSKTHGRMVAYGAVDELNSWLGFLAASVSCPEPFPRWIFAIQNDLFHMGSDLATPLESRGKNMVIVGNEEALILEKMIDFCQGRLPALRQFILPGGTQLAAAFHIARTVCRRAERESVALKAQDVSINSGVLIYLNRLSDLLFVMSRVVCHEEKAGTECHWQKDGGVKSLLWTSDK